MTKFLPLALLIATTSALLAAPWTTYKNERFGYEVLVPDGLTVVSRAADGSGVVWQTGTVRMEVSGTNNPYEIKPHEWFAKVRASAGAKVLEERRGKLKSGGYWHEIFFLKKSRRVHRRTYIAGGSVNTLDFSYGYAHRKAKYGLGLRVLQSFKPGELEKTH